ncbi:glutathione S-transferase family protein [Variovorax paradoxus]|uniref:Glutathionine S-transferase n=1 Tax=Variovorax paradoxus TaxID=34073 RepID=A0A0H2LS32_VARPD|nr:glutathione S-transferase family protein [Variovorax paradoxus]KLN53098.1 glutathionine S-transferase [Variovorax paradoxus]
MLLYGSTDSGHSYKVRFFLLLSGTSHSYQWIDLGTPRSERLAAFVAASKFGEVPVLIDDGIAHCQSNAILMHLAQRTNAFRGHGAEWRSILEWLSWEANRIGFSAPNLRFSSLWEPQPPDVLAYLRKRVLADLQTLDEALSRTEFLLPSGPTIADISCSAYLFWLSQTGFAEADYPHIERWLGLLRALPGWMHPDEAMRPAPLAAGT